MKIFVGYGYNERDEWVEDLVFPLIEAFGDSPVEGKAIFGADLDDGVRGLIKECDALMGFATRRDEPDQNGVWKTHRWVIEEIATANAQVPKIPFVEVREVGVDPQLGIGVGKAHIRYDEKARDRCLVALAQTISRWHTDMRVWALQLQPDAFIEAIRPRIGDGNLRCNFQLINPNNGKETGVIATSIVRQREGLFVYLNNLPSERLVRLQVSCGAKFLWASEYQNPDTRFISLKEEQIL
jgi:hypothetical protein